MNHTTLVSTELLEQHLNDSRWIIIDCCFSLTEPEAGAKAYRMGHIPGAHYAHLEKDLSSTKKTYTGRHPLPHFN